MATAPLTPDVSPVSSSMISTRNSYSSEDEGIDKPQIFIDATIYGEVLAEVDKESSISRNFRTPTRSFVNLVGRDLSEAERAHAEGFAQFIANNWSQEEDDLDGEANFTLEPEAYEEDADGVLYSPASVDSTFNLDGWPPDKSAPNAEKIVQLLIHEFGPLTSNMAEEKLLGQYDAGICEDVVIVVSGSIEI